MQLLLFRLQTLPQVIIHIFTFILPRLVITLLVGPCALYHLHSLALAWRGVRDPGLEELAVHGPHTL